MVDWKKEIKLSDLVGGKKRERDAEPDDEPTIEKPQKTSIWKKEITFGRKKDKAAESSVVADAEDGENIVAAQAVFQPSADPAATTPQPAGDVAGPAVALPELPPTSLQPPPTSAADPVAAPSVPQSVEPIPAWATARPPQNVVERITPKAQQTTPDVLQPFVPPPLRDMGPGSEAPTAQPLVDNQAAEVEPGTVPEVAGQPTSAIPESTLPQPFEVEAPQPSPAQQAPAPAPTPAPAPQPAAPQVVHPPVPADQLPPIEDEERKPFYKRDLSFGRKRGKDASRPRGGRRQDATARKKLPKSLVGLKIGASQIAAARVANNGAAELLQVAREPLEAGIVVAGELREPDSLAEALKGFFSKHKLPKRGVRLGIANNRIGVRAFEIGGVEDPRQLENAIRFRAQEVLPIPVEDAVLDYHVLSERVGDEGETVRRILLVVTYRELVDRYLDACRRAGITLSGIDLEGFALLRSLQAAPEDVEGDSALVAVTIGHERSTFAVSDGRTCEFTRVIDWGGAALNVAIARALDMAPAEAEPIKLALSLYGTDVPAGLTETQAAAAREAIGRQIQSFARELVSSLQFYQSQPGSLGIAEIVITGGTAHLPGLDRELERLIGVIVRIGDPLARVKVSKKFDEPEQVGSLAVAIGLGIEG